MSVWNVVKIAGVFVSWCIGSGFVTGQEVLQYFAGFGVWGYVTIFTAMAIHVFLCYSFFSVGFDHRFKNPLDIFVFYCGKRLAKAFQVCSLGLLAAAPIAMMAGFGAAVEQHFGISSKIGCILFGILALATILLGLRRLVDICGVIGPLIVIIAILTGVIYLIQNHAGVAEGIRMGPTLPLSKIAPFWFMSAYYYVAPLHAAPYLSSAATTCNHKKEALWGGVFGVLAYATVVTLMVTAQFSNIEVLSQQMVPNLYIASSIAPALGLAFVFLIFMGIYSSAVPCLFTICANFFKEKTPKYRIFAVIVCVVSTFVSTSLPFDRLFSIIYGVTGFIGGLLILLMIIKHIRIRLNPELGVPAVQENAEPS